MAARTEDDDYWLGTPAPIPRAFRVVAWAIAVVNVVVVYRFATTTDVFRVLALDAGGLLAVHKPEMFEDSERYDVGQQRWLRAVVSEQTVWYTGWLILLLPLILYVGGLVGDAISESHGG